MQIFQFCAVFDKVMVIHWTEFTAFSALVEHMVCVHIFLYDCFIVTVVHYRICNFFGKSKYAPSPEKLKFNDIRKHLLVRYKLCDGLFFIVPYFLYVNNLCPLFGSFSIS